MLNTMKVLVAPANTFFLNFYKTISLSKKAKFQIYFYRKNHLCHQKGDKKTTYDTLLWLLLFFALLLSYERLKPFF